MADLYYFDKYEVRNKYKTEINSENTEISIPFEEKGSSYHRYLEADVYNSISLYGENITGLGKTTYIGNDITNIPTGRYYNKGSNWYRLKEYKRTSSGGGNNEWGSFTVYFAIYVANKVNIVFAGEERGGFISRITGTYNQYPENGKHTDGYWYVRGEAVNTPPTLTDNTINNKTLYEGNVLTLTGNLLDSDNGDVISVKYNINGGTARAISSGISDGKAPLPYNKSLLFKEGKLYDGATAVSNQLSDNTKHLIKIWGEDDKGGKSEVKEIFFYVVNNRPATLIINPVTEQNDLIDTDTILITGNVTDPDGNETTINYKMNSGSFITIDTGQDRDFEIRIPVSSLIDGNNNITIQAKDSYGAISEKIVKLNKEKKVQPLKTAVREYKMIPPDGTAKGILLWIQREVGDLTTKVEIKFGNKPYQELPVNHTGLVTTGLEEDEYVYENDTEESEISLRITMNRTSTTSNKGIKLISGVFN